MTETEWLCCTDPIRMLGFLQNSGKPSDRKLRLFAVACSRRFWDFLDDLGRGAVDLAELFADGLTDAEEMRRARLACTTAGGRAVWYAAASNPSIAARNAALCIQSVLAAAADLAAEQKAQADLLRDIVGDTLRPETLDPSWLTPATTALAQIVYENRRFGDLPVLADTLEIAGCTDAALLGHCRQPGEHARGCWALDVMLGKE